MIDGAQDEARHGATDGNDGSDGNSGNGAGRTRPSGTAA